MSEPENLSLFSHPKTSEKIQSLLPENFKGLKILDLGAGQGGFTQRLYGQIQQTGEQPETVITACDLFPEDYLYSKIPCQKIDVNGRFPFEDDQFDTVISIEVIEHLPDQFHFIEEIARITRPGGTAFISTPNILNANGRLRYFFTGTWPLFDILPIASHNVIHVSGHIAPISLYYMYYFAKRAGFRECRFHVDRKKRSALLLAPFIYAVNKLLSAKFTSRRKLKKGDAYEENLPVIKALNSFDTLLGRTIIMEAIK
ncbi:MAG: methyltransferase domain-containing protein [Candidatus Hydrogenedentota bacterium]